MRILSLIALVAVMIVIQYPCVSICSEITFWEDENGVIHFKQPGIGKDTGKASVTRKQPRTQLHRASEEDEARQGAEYKRQILEWAQKNRQPEAAGRKMEKFKQGKSEAKFFSPKKTQKLDTTKLLRLPDGVGTKYVMPKKPSWQAEHEAHQRAIKDYMRRARSDPARLYAD